MAIRGMSCHNGPRPTLCVIHGFMADPYWVNSKLLELRWFYEQGYDILLYTLPFHGKCHTLSDITSDARFSDEDIEAMVDSCSNTIRIDREARA